MTKELFLEITVAQEQQFEAFASALKEALAKNFYHSSDLVELTKDLEDLTLEISDTNLLDYENFRNTIEDIFKSVAKSVSNALFRGEAVISNYTSADEIIYRIDCDGEKASVEILEVSNYFALCPECGCEICNADNFNPDKTYACPECGETIDMVEAFEGSLPTFTRYEFNIK